MSLTLVVLPTETAPVDIHRVAYHLVGRDALALVFGMGHARIGQVERGIYLLGRHRRIGRIDHGIAAVHTL